MTSKSKIDTLPDYNKSSKSQGNAFQINEESPDLLPASKGKTDANNGNALHINGPKK